MGAEEKKHARCHPLTHDSIINQCRRSVKDGLNVSWSDFHGKSSNVETGFGEGCGFTCVCLRVMIQWHELEPCVIRCHSCKSLRGGRINLLCESWQREAAPSPVLTVTSCVSKQTCQHAQLLFRACFWNVCLACHTPPPALSLSSDPLSPSDAPPSSLYQPSFFLQPACYCSTLSFPHSLLMWVSDVAQLLV